MNVEKILVVDDDRQIVDSIAIFLKGEGYGVYKAYDGIEALETLGEREIHLMILDIMMPRMDGYEFTRVLREGGSTLPILMVTAKETPADKHKGFIIGTDDYMTKPVDEEEMVLRIAALLRRSKIASSRRLEVGNFVMDADERSATLNGEEISLTAREFDLLYKLLSYPKKTFTRTQLMDEFWDVDTQTSTRTVDVYMTKLRAKLAECDSFEIQTVHGLGYKAVIK